MDYKDALSACIDAVRAGESPQRAVAAYPEHAARLLDDVSLAGAVRSYAVASAQPSDDVTARARQRLTGELQTLRAARPAPVQSPKRAGGGSSFGLPRFAFAAVVAVVAVGLLGFASGIFGNAQTAEAETIDGVVVEKSTSSLLVQTEDGMQTIDLAGVSVTDETGAELSPGALEPGQVVAVRAKRLKAGALRALSVQRRPATSLEDWCRTHPVRCQELEPRLPEGVIACRVNPSACATVVPPPPPAATPQGGANLDRLRLQELSNRCWQSGGEGCEELRRFCRANVGLCTALAGWLRAVVDLPDDARERLRLHSQRCQDGSILDCRELRLLCERLREACPVLTPQRPRAEATRPLQTPTRFVPVSNTPARQIAPQQQQQLPAAPTQPVQRPNR